MSIVTVCGPFLDMGQMRELARGLTKVASEICQRPAEHIIVVIREKKPENVAVGAKLAWDRSGESA